MKIKCGRTEFLLKDTDLIMYNGACYQIITIKFGSRRESKIPIIAKSKAEKLIKEGLLKEVNLKEPPYKGNQIKYYSI